jgi:hypothetical protein
MTDERTFPVLWPVMRKDIALWTALECPKVVPWAFIADHAEACVRLHDQTPERLAERGGLAPNEMLAVIEPRRPTYARVHALWYSPPEASVPALKAALEQWQLRQKTSDASETGSVKGR